MRHLSRAVVAGLLLMQVATVASGQSRPGAGRSPRPAALREAAANNNDRPGGVLVGRVLTMRLEIVRALWKPEGEAGPVREVYAFAEEGKAPQIPGPLIRVPEGTEVLMLVRNRVSDSSLTVHGLVTRPGTSTSAFTIAPDSVRELRFRVGAPGTYFYWATAGAPLAQRSGSDSQLNGALVVDPADGPSQHQDRVFVMSEWLGPVPAPGEPRKVSLAINGRSWPHTERLALTFGQAESWRVINATFGAHPMHLHGTFYTVEHRGDALRDVIYGTDGRRLVTTELMESGGTMLMRWVPDRVGNWLFHCHILAHVTGAMREGDMTSAERAEASAHVEHDPVQAMAGLVLGIHVSEGDETAAPDLERHERRRLTMDIGTVAQRYGPDPAFGFAIRSPGADEPAFDTLPTLSPVLVLNRGEPVAISVKNHTDQPTAIHWHGIELESYHDGVPGWSGVSNNVMPPVNPGETFEVRYTPPRTGTFIYHTHGHDSKQLVSGLYGALLVVEPGKTFDPEVDHVVLIGGAGPSARGFEVNRSTNPTPMLLKLGVKHRFRIINITPNGVPNVLFRSESGPLQWKAVAKDGADLPPSQTTNQPARLRIGVGETYDFEFAPTAVGDLRLEVFQNGARGTVTSMIVRVVP